MNRIKFIIGGIFLTLFLNTGVIFVDYSYTFRTLARRVKNINAEDINLTLARLKIEYPRLDFSDIAYPSILHRLWKQIRILGLNFGQFINQIYQGIDKIQRLKISVICRRFSK